MVTIFRYKESFSNLPSTWVWGWCEPVLWMHASILTSTSTINGNHQHQPSTSTISLNINININPHPSTPNIKINPSPNINYYLKYQFVPCLLQPFVYKMLPMWRAKSPLFFNEKVAPNYQHSPTLTPTLTPTSTNINQHQPTLTPTSTHIKKKSQDVDFSQQSYLPGLPQRARHLFGGGGLCGWPRRRFWCHLRDAKKTTRRSWGDSP